MSESKRNTFIQVFSKLPQKILWKMEAGMVDRLPDNVMVASWFPQQDILGHPKTRLFISSVGQSSSQETLCHKKPVVRKKFIVTEPQHNLNTASNTT